MKFFTEPSVEFEELEILDVITTSSDCDMYNADCPNDLGGWSLR